MTRQLLFLLALMVASCGSQPVDAPAATWTLRLDDPDEQDTPERVTALATGGVDVKAGGNATLWHPEGNATGTYRLSMQVTTTNEGLHAHGAGLVFGGLDIDGPKQAYTYFLVRGDRAFLIKTRDADDTEMVCEWTRHDAIHDEDDTYTASNRLEVEVGAEMTRFLINGKQVHTTASSELPTQGRYGGRLVHDLRVRFDDLRLETQAK